MEDGGPARLNRVVDGSVCVAYLGKTWHQDALWEEAKPAGAVFCWETLTSDGLFQQDISPCQSAETFQEWFEETRTSLNCWSRSHQACVGCSGQTSQIQLRTYRTLCQKPQQSFRGLHLNRSGLFWSKEVHQLNIRQVVLILWLISVNEGPVLEQDGSLLCYFHYEHQFAVSNHKKKQEKKAFLIPFFSRSKSLKVLLAPLYLRRGTRVHECGSLSQWWLSLEWYAFSGLK